MEPIRNRAISRSVLFEAVLYEALLYLVFFHLRVEYKSLHSISEQKLTIWITVYLDAGPNDQKSLIKQREVVVSLQYLSMLVVLVNLMA